MGILLVKKDSTNIPHWIFSNDTQILSTSKWLFYWNSEDIL